MPADHLPVELQASFEAARDKSQEEGHAAAVQDIAEAMEMPLEETERHMRALEDLPTVTRELMMRRIADAWLEGLRKAFLAARMLNIRKPESLTSIDCSLTSMWNR